MSDGFDGDLADLLRAHVEGYDAPPEAVATAVREGRRRRQRRRTALAASASLATVAVLCTATLLARGTGTGPGVGATGGNGGHAGIPPAAKEPGLGVRPDLVGGDPGVIHFRLDHLPRGTASARWSVAGGVESVRLTMTRGGTALIEAGRDRGFPHDPHGPCCPGAASRTETPDNQPSSTVATPLNPVVPGSGGRITATSLSPTPTPTRPPVGTDTPSTQGDVRAWSPRPGVRLALRSQGPGHPDLDVLTRLLRFDRSERCPVPFEVDLPTGARVTSCAVELPVAAGGTPARASARIDVADSRGGAAVSLRTGTSPDDRPAGGSGTYTTVTRGATVSASPTGSWGLERATALVEAIRFTADPARPSTW